MNSQEIKQAFEFRHATKTFNPAKKVSDEDFNLILEAARLSPSSFGFEPWNLIVVNDPSIREELKQNAWGAQGTLPTASYFIVITAKTSQALGPEGTHIDHIYETVKHYTDTERNAKSKQGFYNWVKNDFHLFDAPQLLHQWAARQAYLALGNMMTVAALRGIDSCPIEGFNIEKVTHVLQNHGLINIDTDLPVAMVAFGYRSIEQPEKTRRSLSEIVRVV